MGDVGATDGIVSSALAVAPDYDGSDNTRRVVYVGTNSGGTDGIYRVAASSAGTRRPDNGDTKVSNIAIAGSIASPMVLYSVVSTTNGNTSYLTTDFTSGSSMPTISSGKPIPGTAGDATTQVTVGLSPDGGTAFALVNDLANGGFSRSADGGKTYSQISLLNNVEAFTTDASTIAGFAVSPNFDTSGHMIAGASGSGSDVTLYSANGGANWMVVDTGGFVGNIAFAYSPDFATDNTIYSADLGAKTLRRSTNGGLTWKNRSSVACAGTSTISSIAAADESTVFVGCSDGGFRKSVNGGFLFTTARGTGGGPVSDIAMSPSYAEDNSILIGQGGDARLSTNGGSSFSRLGSGVGSGATQVAFHSDYATNDMVYAGNDKAYRWTVGTSTSWKTLAGPTMVVGLGVGADGTLYAASAAAFDDAATGGIFTSATPTASSVTLAQVGVAGSGVNLMAGEMVGGFAHATIAGSERLWVSITNPGGVADEPKADNWRHYTDTIGSMLRPTGLTPADGAVVGTSNALGSGVTGFRIGWDAVAGATEYNYQWDTSSTFDSAVVCTSVPVKARSVAEGKICDDERGSAGQHDLLLAGPGCRAGRRPLLGDAEPDDGADRRGVGGPPDAVPAECRQPSGPRRAARCRCARCSSGRR